MTMTSCSRRVRNEDGVALVLTLLLMMALSAAASSLMFLSQSETYSSLNYRLMSQARYGAEAGVQKTMNYLINTYTPPTTGGADALASYDMTVSPVTFNGAPVILSGDGTVASNYPVGGVQNAFSAAAQGTLPSGNTSVTYVTSATLLSMQQVDVYGGGVQTIQTWRIRSGGSITTGRTGQVEVTAILETQKVSATMYAAFATSPNCSALTFTGNSSTDSYDSAAALVGGNPVLANASGNVGTNGNLGESSNATINGSLSTPRVGVGACDAGNVDALSQAGNATVTGGVIQLPHAIVLAPPLPPNPLPPTGNVTINNGASCASLGLVAPATCAGAHGDLTIDPHGSVVSLADLSLTGGANVTLIGGTYNINSISFAGNSTFTVSAGTGPVIVNSAGKTAAGGDLATPLDFTGGSISNGSFDPSQLQIRYAGAGTVKLSGGSQSAAMIYAPGAAAMFAGGGDFYGSVVGRTVVDTGGARIHYDRRLNSSFFVAGNPMMTSFGWSKY